MSKYRFINKFLKSILTMNFEMFADKNLETKANLSKQEVIKIAGRRGEIEGWSLEDMQSPHLTVEEDKLVWRVRFAAFDENNLPLKGGHLLLKIDDQTGNLIEKITGTR